MWVRESQVLDNITHMHEIRVFPMVWRGRGCGMRLELKIFFLKEFLFLSTQHCQWCCHFAWTGGDKILCLGILWHHLLVGCGEGSFEGAQREFGLELLVLSVLEAKGSCLRKQLGQIMFHNCVLSKAGVNSVSEALVLPLPCAKCPQCYESNG